MFPRIGIPRRWLSLLACGAMLLGSWAGGIACDGTTDTAATRPAARQPEPLRVLAGVYPVSDVARQVGGPRVTIDWFREAGQPPDALLPNPDRLARLRTADLVIASGAAHPWMLEGSDNPARATRIVRLDGLATARVAPGGGVTTAPADGSSPAYDASAYVWLDPDVATRLAGEVAGRLAALDVRRGEQYRANARAFAAEVDQIARSAAPALAAVRGRPFLSLDPGFAPLAERFGMVVVPWGEGASAGDVVLSPGAVGRLRDAARTSGASAVFVPSDTPPGVVRDLRVRLDLPIVPLDPLGTSAPTGRSTYQQVLRYNLEQLANAR